MNKVLGKKKQRKEEKKWKRGMIESCLVHWCHLKKNKQKKKADKQKKQLGGQ